MFDGNSVTFEWEHKGEIEQGHHIGFFYKITKYNNNIKLSNVNHDSLGAQYYDISKLAKSDLSDIASLEVKKLGYKLD